jgi:hypothetical protein
MQQMGGMIQQQQHADRTTPANQLIEQGIEQRH